MFRKLDIVRKLRYNNLYSNWVKKINIPYEKTCGNSVGFN